MNTVANNFSSRAYYENTYLDRLESKVTSFGRDEKGIYYVFERTIFHPQGGGQPSDKGRLASPNGSSFEVVQLSEAKDESNGEIRHYLSSDVQEFPFTESEMVHQTIDLEARREYAKLHTGGHLLAGVIESLFSGLEGYRGNHFPDNQAFVMFKGSPFPDKEELNEKTQAMINGLISEKRPVRTDNSGEVRTVTIEGLKTYPCGGTHLNHLGEMNSFEIRSIKVKKGEMRIGYNVT